MENLSTPSAYKRIMYLAPEVPALSATFVYNELLEMKSIGHHVSVASVHRPGVTANSEIQEQVGEVFFLYNSPALIRIQSLIKAIFIFHIAFSKALFMLLKDVFSAGLFTRNAAGLCFRFLSACEFAIHCRRHFIEHIHVHFAHISTDIAMYAAFMLKVPFSVTSHANDIFERGFLLKKKIERSAFFATISNFNKNFLDKLVHNKEKIKVIHCGVDKRKFETRKNQPQNSKFVFGLLGRLVEKKGTHILLESIAVLKSETDKFEVQIIGDGPEKDRLELLSRKLDIVSQVTFLGKMSHDKVSKWLASLDCFVLPCVKDKNGDMDGIPVSLMEAMLIGVPVISTNVSGVPELILNGQTGLIAETSSAESLVDKMNQLMNVSETETEKLVTNAVEHINRSFELTNNCRLLSGLINND